MAILKYWDERTSDWVQVAGMYLDDGYLRVTGGRMTGPLVVEGDLTTTGYVHAGYILGTDDTVSIDANIVMREDRYAYFGHSEVVGVADPVASDDLANRGYLSAVSSASKAVYPLMPGPGWENYGAEYGPFRARQSSDGMVAIEGAVRATAPMRPGPLAEPIAVLPPSMCPAYRKVFPVAGSSISNVVRVDVFPDGAIRVISVTSEVVPGFWLAFHDLCFYPD